jgi:hypothetical protein
LITMLPYQAFNEISRVCNRVDQLRRAKRFVRRNASLAGERSPGPRPHSRDARGELLTKA